MIFGSVPTKTTWVLWVTNSYFMWCESPRSNPEAVFPQLVFRNSGNVFSAFLWQDRGFLDIPLWCSEPLNTAFTTSPGTRWAWDHVSPCWDLSLSKQWLCPCGLMVHMLFKGNKDADSWSLNLLGWIDSDVTSCMSVKLHLVQDLYILSMSLNLLLSPIEQLRCFCEENCQGQNISIPPRTSARLAGWCH